MARSMKGGGIVPRYCITPIYSSANSIRAVMYVSPPASLLPLPTSSAHSHTCPFTIIVMTTQEPNHQQQKKKRKKKKNTQFSNTNMSCHWRHSTRYEYSTAHPVPNHRCRHGHSHSCLRGQYRASTSTSSSRAIVSDPSSYPVFHSIRG